MNKYEGMFILRPSLDDETRNNIIEKIKSVIEAKGTVENVDEWGTRKLAYDIQKNKDGYYFLINFEADGTVIEELNRIVTITEIIMRHMVVRREA